MKIHNKSIIGIIIALLVGLGSATSRGECKKLCSNDIHRIMSNSFCNSALKSSPASVSLNHRNCLHGMKLAVRKTCLPTCVGEEIALTSFDICSKHYRHRDQIDWCRRGYDSGLNSMALLLGVDQDQESVTPTHDEPINVATSMEEESLIEEEFLTIESVSIESEEVTMKSESISLVLDDHSAESSSLTFEEENTIIQVSTSYNKTDDSTALITNSSNIHTERSLMPYQGITHTLPCLDTEMTTSFVKDDVISSSNINFNQSLVPLHVPYQGIITHTIPCLDNLGMNMSIVKDDASYDVSLDKPDSKELLPAISHDTLDANPISSVYFVTSAAVFFASIIIRLSAVHCWALLHGIISCLKSTTFLGRAFLTTRSIADTLKRAAVLMMTIISLSRCGMDTTTSLIRILLLPIDSLLNIPRFIWRVYGPGSYGRSVWHIMFKSNPQTRHKRCKVASTLNDIFQGLIDTGQASLLKMTSLLFTSARLVQVLAIISYVLVHTVAVSISENVGDCLYIIRGAFVDMIRLIRVLIVKSSAFVHSAFILPYHVRASIFGMARQAYILIVISYAIVHSVAASIFEAVEGCLYHVQSSLDGMACWIQPLAVIPYALVHSIVETMSKATRCCIHYTRASIFDAARRIQVSIIISYVLARSVAESISNDVGGCLCHILSPLSGILLVPYWYWKEFGPYSQGRSVFDILFKSNPQHRRRLKRGGQVASSRLNNIETYTFISIYPGYTSSSIRASFQLFTVPIHVLQWSTRSFGHTGCIYEYP